MVRATFALLPEANRQLSEINQLVSFHFSLFNPNYFESAQIVYDDLWLTNAYTPASVPV